MFDYVWLCRTMYDYIWLCMTMFDYVWVSMTKYKREKESNFKNFFILFPSFWNYKKISNNLNFFHDSNVFKLFILFNKPGLCLPLFTFVYLCLPFLNWRIYAQILCLFCSSSEWLDLSIFWEQRVLVEACQVLLGFVNSFDLNSILSKSSLQFLI